MYLVLGILPWLESGVSMSPGWGDSVTHSLLCDLGQLPYLLWASAS